MKYYDIKIGSLNNPSFRFNNESISSATLAMGVDVIGDKLTIDVGEIGVIYNKDEIEYFTTSDYDLIISSDNYELATSWVADDIRLLKYGTPIWIYKENNLRAKMYVKNVERINKTKYKLNLISAIGLLDSQTYVGNLFNGKRFDEVIAEIIGGTIGTSQGGIIPIIGGIIDCYVENEAAAQFVFGHLPVTTKREALHQLMFAYNTILTKDTNGDIIFSYLYNTTPSLINDSDIYLGGNVDYSAPASRVDLTEHTYEVLGDEEEIVLFDNLTSGGDPADHTWVYFNNAPIQTNTLDFGTLTRISYGVNYAVVSGTGILKGRPYTHVKTIVSRDVVTSQEEKVVQVDNATLVTMANSVNVADRLISYYSSKKTVKADIVLNDESCGRLVSFRDPFDIDVTNQGYIAKMTINHSETDKAQCEIITDYVPTGHGNNFQHAVVLSGSGTWTIPSEVFEKENPIIKAIIIGGGSGGGTGGTGQTGGSPTSTGTGTLTDGVGGDGGAAGVGGDGGKITTQLIDCENLTTIAYACGQGGASGQEGTDTTFGSYSSSTGTRSQYGVINLFTSQVYGYKGKDGLPGGKGNTGGNNVTYNGATYYVGATGNSYSGTTGFGKGGQGGGACYGSNGGRGQNAHEMAGYTACGDGGTGASCNIYGENATIYGCGGSGGNGGGGGGGGGGGTTYSTIVYSHGGAGGQGSGGGQGADGCIVVYY